MNQFILTLYQNYFEIVVNTTPEFTSNDFVIWGNVSANKGASSYTVKQLDESDDILDSKVVQIGAVEGIYQILCEVVTNINTRKITIETTNSTIVDIYYIDSPKVPYKCKIRRIWRKLTRAWCKIDDSWQPIVKAYGNKEGIWKKNSL